MTQLIDLLVNRLSASLTTALIRDVPSSSPTRAKVVQAYRFQEDPLSNNNYAYITGGQPQAPFLPDGRLGSNDMEDLGLKLPYGEVGGGHYWWRRGTVVIGSYFVNQQYTQLVAANYAHIFLGRAMTAIESTPVSDLVDEFGEQAFYIFVYASHFNEGGGPTNQYLWRGEVFWQALTHRPI